MSSPSIRTSHATLAGLAASARAPLTVRVSGALDLLMTWQERVAQRRRLRALDNHMLSDLGLSRADAENEAGKPFWRP